MTVALSQAVRDLVESRALAHVVTIDPDGAPHVSLAWIGLEADEIVFATLPDQRKLRNLRRDPRITISIEGARTNEWGLREYVVLTGTAVVTERRCTRTAATPRAHVHRPWREVSGHAQPAAWLCHARPRPARFRYRPLDLGSRRLCTMYSAYIVRRTQIYLDEAQATAVANRARRRGVTASHVIREAIDDYLAEPEDASERELARFRAALDRSFATASLLPESAAYVAELRAADRERAADIETRRRR